MSESMRAWIGLSLLAVAVTLAGVLYHWLPSTAGSFGRLVVSANLALPLFTAGLLLATPLGARSPSVRRRVLLGTAVMTLVMAREAARMRGNVVPPMLAIAYQGALMGLLAVMAREWWKARRPSPAADVGVR